MWETTKMLRYYLDKYHLFDASSGSLGMDDVYGNRPSAFRQHLEQHLEGHGWCRIHFHAIGPGLTDPQLYDQHLTIDVTLPPTWIAGEVKTRRSSTHEVSVPTVAVSDGRILRFQVLPITATYVIERRL